MGKCLAKKAGSFLRCPRFVLWAWRFKRKLPSDKDADCRGLNVMSRATKLTDLTDWVAAKGRGRRPLGVGAGQRLGGLPGSALKSALRARPYRAALPRVQAHGKDQKPRRQALKFALALVKEEEMLLDDLRS